MPNIIVILFVLILSSCSGSKNIISLPSEPCLIPKQGVNFILCDKYIVYINDVKYIVPDRFETDLASIPRFMWPMYAPNDTSTIPASIIHDYLYYQSHKLTRKQIDNIFYDLLVIKGTSKYTAYKYWIGVRLFGGYYFNGNDIEASNYALMDDEMLDYSDCYSGEYNNANIFYCEDTE